MANIGFSQPYTADYTNTNGTITYANLTKLGKGTTFSVAIDGKEPQILYADNGPAESVSTFGGGTATLGIDELSLAEAANILGLTTPTSTGGLTFSADAVAPYKALCAIAKKVYQGVVKWRLIVLYKVQFMTPDYTVDTEGETVTFQTPELEAQILRDDATPSKWQFWQDFDTEAAAIAGMRTALGIT